MARLPDRRRAGDRSAKVGRLHRSPVAAGVARIACVMPSFGRHVGGTTMRQGALLPESRKSMRRSAPQRSCTRDLSRIRFEPQQYFAFRGPIADPKEPCARDVDLRVHGQTATTILRSAAFVDTVWRNRIVLSRAFAASSWGCGAFILILTNFSLVGSDGLT